MFYINVSNGLLEGDHEDRMGDAVWLFMRLLDKITRIDEQGNGWVLGGKPIKLSELAGKRSRSTVSRRLKVLGDQGYIVVKYAPHGIIIMVCKAKKRFSKVAKPGEATMTNQVAQERATYIDNNNKTINQSDGAAVAERKKSDVSLVVDHFFKLKGWDNFTKEDFVEQKIVYSRYTKPAKDLLALCSDDVDRAKTCLDKVGEWAVSRKLDWSIETVFKKWRELDSLAAKEKQPYFNGCRMFQVGETWFVLGADGVKRTFAGSMNDVVYR